MSAELADWYRHHAGVELTEDQARCLATLCAVERCYNLIHYLAGETVGEKIQPLHEGLRVRFRGELATFDSDGLTRLLLAAHENCCRVSISPLSGTTMEIMVFPRDPDGVRFYDGHAGPEKVEPITVELAHELRERRKSAGVTP